MRRRSSVHSAIVVGLAGLALFAMVALPSRASAGPAKTAGASSKVLTVVIRGFKFEPAIVTVHPGDTVEWRNEGIVPHTATAETGTMEPAFASGPITAGGTWSYVPRKSGTYDYICIFHPNMKGRLIVR